MTIRKLTPQELRQIKDGPIRHQTLFPELLAKLEQSYRLVGYLQCSTLEEWERNFMRDTNPDSEADIWLAIGKACQKLWRLSNTTDDAVKIDNYTLLIVLASGGETQLTETEKKLWRLYRRERKKQGLPSVKIIETEKWTGK